MWADPEDARTFWRLFKDSPLFAKWPEFEKSIPYTVLRDTFPPDHTIFQRGEPPLYLYLVGSGRVRQLVSDTRRPWLQIEHGAGSFFGQQALFYGRHQSTAVVREAATIYRITAADVRTAMQHDVGLRETLLRETRTSRLRRIPLLSGLEDSEIRWLAQVIEELTYDALQELPLAAMKGLWIIDWGQVAITGPASFIFDDAGVDPTHQSWRLTAGNFFLTADSDVGKNCIAATAIAYRKTRLLYLPAEHTRRLFRAIPAVSDLALKPLDIAEVLRGVARADVTRPQPLFASPPMRPAHFQHLAQFCAWEFIPVGQNITTQGNLGHSFVILRKGAAVIRALDENGRLRPQSTLRTMASSMPSYGETSLLQGKARDATVRAVQAAGQGQQHGPGGAEIILLDRRDLQVAFDERPDLWQKGLPLFDGYQRVKQEKRTFDWQEEDEIVIRYDRTHWLWLVRPLLAVAALYLLTLLIVYRLARPENVLLTTTLIISGIYALLAAAFVYNYFNDYYALTSRRVTSRHRELSLAQTRVEIPIEMIQDITSQVGFWGALFDYGDVSIRSAAKSSPTVFAHVPGPDHMRQAILDAKSEATVAQAGLRREILRRGLMNELRQDVMIPERTRPLGPDAPSSDQVRRSVRPRKLPTSKVWPPAWFVRMAQGFPARLRKALLPRPPAPPQTVSARTYVWRKHWLRLVARAGPYALGIWLLLFVFAWLIANKVGQTGLGPIRPAALFVLWFIAFGAALFGLWYEWADYRNDMYVVTESALITIMRKPLAMSAVQRQGNLDRVQTVDARQPTFWANLFGYGDVIIRTAAADEGYDFLFVANPQHVQSIIFQRMGEARRGQEEREKAKRQQEIMEGLQVYHQLQQSQQAQQQRKQAEF